MLIRTNAAWALEGIGAAHPGHGDEDPPCTSVSHWSTWNMVFAHRGGSMGDSVDTPTGNSGSCTVSLSLTTTLPARRDTTCILSFPLRYKSESAGGKEVATWPGRGNRCSDVSDFSIKVFKTGQRGPGCDTWTVHRIHVSSS